MRGKLTKPKPLHNAKGEHRFFICALLHFLAEHPGCGGHHFPALRGQKNLHRVIERHHRVKPLVDRLEIVVNRHEQPALALIVVAERHDNVKD